MSATAPTYDTLASPTTGQPITMSDGILDVPADPIIPFIEGDGTGPDIWQRSRMVLDAAVAAGLRRRPDDRLVRGLRRGEGQDAIRQLAAGRHTPCHGALPGRHQGPAHHAGGRWFPVPQRDATAETRSVRLRSAGAVVPGRPSPREAPGTGRHGDLPGEHRRHLRGNRVSGRDSGGAGAHRLPGGQLGATMRFPETQRHRRQTHLGRRHQAVGAERHRVCLGPGTEERDAGPQGQHHEVHRGRLPRLGLRGGAGGVRRDELDGGPWLKLPDGSSSRT